MDYFRRMLSAMRVAPSSEELGRRTSVYPEEDRRSSHANAEEGKCPVIESSEKLVEFRLLVGITTHGSFRAPRGFEKNQKPVVTTRGRPAPNRGIYVTVVDSEIKCKRSYKFASRLINFCLGLQIIVAAALTALGAAKGSSAAVTVFGAVNTVIAGFLTYLKGSGLPNRLKYFQHEWSKVREYIEQRERDLSIGNNIDISEEISIIRDMFEEVRADVEANQPDRFIGTGSLSNRRPVVPPGPSIAGAHIRRISSTMSEPLKEKASDMRHTFDSIDKEVEVLGATTGSQAHNFRMHLVDDIGQLKNVVQEKMREVAQLERQIVEHGKKFLERKEGEVQDKVKEVDELEKTLESDGRRVLSGSDNAVHRYTLDNMNDGEVKAGLDLDEAPQGGYRLA